MQSYHLGYESVQSNPQQNQNALGSYDSAAIPPPTLSDTSGGTMNSTNNDNSSIALSVKDAGGIYKWTNAKWS